MNAQEFIAQIEASRIVTERITAERLAQVERWGNDFDDRHSQNDWVAFITAYAGKGFDTKAGTNGQYPDEAAFEQAMIKVGALAIAALEALERSRKMNSSSRSFGRRIR